MKHLIPDEVFEQHVIVLGKTRSGKSSVMRLCVEHLLQHDNPVCIVDPKGDWWGLKSSADGKEAGYPVVIFGGEHADVPLNSRSGGAVAELVATENRSSIIDLGGWMPGERTQFWIDFASTFFRLHRGRHYLVIDEVHNFCPKGKIMDPNAGKMLHWSNRLASEGLGKGISLLAASQRPQKVHNDFLTSCETLIAMRVIHAADRRAFEDWIDGCGDPEKGPEVVNSLASLERGEAWVWSPEAKFGPKRLQFPMFDTYDSFKAQKTVAPAKLKGWAGVDLAEVTKKLESVVKEAEAKDPAKLQARIRELEKQVRTPVVKEVANFGLEKSVKRFVEVVIEQRKKEQQEISNWVRKVSGVVRTVKEAADSNLFSMPLVGELPKFSGGEIHIKEEGTPKENPRDVIRQTRPRIDRTGTQYPRPENNGKLRSGAERMLAALAQWSPGGMSEGQMRAHAGLKKSGTFSAYMSDLRRGEFIEERDGMVYATDHGLRYSEHIPEAPKSTEEVLSIWEPKLRDGARRMLRALVDLGGEAISKEELGDRAGLEKSGTFSAYLSDLRTARLATVNGGMVAANKETLFL